MKPDSTHLYLIRHGQTESNRLGILHGLTDWPLNSEGTEQAKLLAKRFASDSKLTTIYSSPLRRSRTTAEFISSASGIPIQIHRAFSEMCFGEAEGASIHDIEHLYPQASVGFLDAQDLDVRFPGGESRREFFSRIGVAIERLRIAHPHQHVAIVAHGGVIAAVLRLLHQDNSFMAEHAHIENCSITHIEVALEFTKMHVYNDIDHLEIATNIVSGGK